MRQDDRAPFDRALQRARVSAYAPGEFAGQESFMTAGEIRALAAQAGIGPGVDGAGPVLRHRRPRAAPHAGAGLRLPGRGRQRERRRPRPRARGRPAVPLRGRAGPAAPSRRLRRRAPARDDARLRGQGRAGPRRSPRRCGPAGASPSRSRRGRRSRRPSGRRCRDADTVWPAPLDEMAASLERAGLVVTWQEDHSRAHRATAQALADAFAADAARHRRADRPPRRWTSCSPPTGCGSSGWTRGGSGSSRSWRSLRARSAGSRPTDSRSEGRARARRARARRRAARAWRSRRPRRS